MGNDTYPRSSREMPVHHVSVPGFEMSRSVVTHLQYNACVDQGGCTRPRTDQGCGVSPMNRDRYPVTCVDWSQAEAFCGWAGGRLPSEAEWEYAARGQGRDVLYPWGDEEPSCDLAVIHAEEGSGCGKNDSWPPCSKPAGNTPQGLCDMAGNVFEWVQDCYHESYVGAPDDGSAWETDCGVDRVMRGGNAGSVSNSLLLRVYARLQKDPSAVWRGRGFRCAR